jgi:DNA-binding transcriptional ArsR family regulator
LKTSRSSLAKRSQSEAAKLRQHAEVFAALGDPVRLSLVAKLVGRRPHSIAELTEGTQITRQAVTKHLRVLQNVGVVHGVKEGRESRFELDAKPLEFLQKYLSVIAAQWDEALHELKMFVEK